MKMIFVRIKKMQKVRLYRGNGIKMVWKDKNKCIGVDG